MTSGNPKIFTRLDLEDRREAQEVADERFDGNLSMLVRIAVKEFVARVRKEKREEVAA